MTIPYERFLIRNRIYCERCSFFAIATQVVKDHSGDDIVVCDSCYKNNLGGVGENTKSVREASASAQNFQRKQGGYQNAMPRV